MNKEKKLVAQRIFLELVQPEKQSVNSLKVTDTRRRVILEKLPNKEHSLELCLDIHLFKGNIAIYSYFNRELRQVFIAITRFQHEKVFHLFLK